MEQSTKLSKSSLVEQRDNRNIISVVAPDNLPEGFEFEAQLDGNIFTVTVVSRKDMNELKI